MVKWQNGKMVKWQNGRMVEWYLELKEKPI